MGVGGFKFNYESLLSLKLGIEKKEKNELAKKIDAYNKEKDVLQRLIQRRDHMIAQMQKGEGKIRIGDLKEYASFIEITRKEIEKQKIMVNDAKRNVDKQRERLQEASKEKKILEKLKEKKMKEFLLEEQKKEQKNMDEMISYKEGKKINEI
jgi:flagellar protein FliJ